MRFPKPGNLINKVSVIGALIAPVDQAGSTAKRHFNTVSR